jgi:hypothetical protein
MILCFHMRCPEQRAKPRRSVLTLDVRYGVMCGRLRFGKMYFGAGANWSSAVMCPAC